MTSSMDTRERDIQRIFGVRNYSPHMMDVQTGKQWDCLKFSSGDPVHRPSTQFFSSPRNHRTGQPKSIAETSLNRPGQLNAPESFAVQRIMFVFSKDADPLDIYGVAESLVFRFWLDQKWFASAPLISLQTSRSPIAPIHICSYCQAVYAVAQQCPGCGAREFRLSGMEEQTGLQFFFEPLHPLVIQVQQSFHVDLDGMWVTRSPFALWCYLEGLHARSVQ